MKVIIGGAQRSGTSFLRAILGSHSDIAMFPYDLRLWTKYLPEFGLKPLAPEDQKMLIQRLLSDEKTVIADDVPSFDEVWARLKMGQNTPVSAMHVFDSFLSSYAQRRGRPIWGHKTPWNEYHAEQLLGEWDDAFFIHLIRNPLDSALSAKYAEGGTWHYDPFLHVKRWRRSAEEAEINAQRFPGRYLVVRYEDLRAEPRSTSQAICGFLGLAFEDEMEKGLKQPGWGGDNSSFTSRGGSSGRNRHRRLPKYLKAFYQEELKREMQRFGYVAAVSRTHLGPLDRFLLSFKRWRLRALYAAIRAKEHLQRGGGLQLQVGRFARLEKDGR